MGTTKHESSNVREGEHNQIQNQAPLDGSLTHINNNLNQALSMQIQPQKHQRGQRRHFPAKNEMNEFELLMKKNQQAVDSEKPKVALTSDHIKKIKISQSTGGKKLIRRGPFAAKTIFDQDTQQQANSPIINGVDSQTKIQTTKLHTNPKSSNPRSAYQQKSIFQKNRHKLTIGSQTQIPQVQEVVHTTDTPVGGGTNYQFKGLFQQNTNSQTGGNMMSQYGQNVFGRNSPKNQNNLSQNQYSTVQQRAQIVGRGYNLQIAQLQGSSSKAKLNENPNNISLGSNAEQTTIAKENLFSPQPKPSSQMSQYGENAKNMNSNTAQLIIRKAKAKNLNQGNDTRHYSLTKTDEKKKSNKKLNNDAKHIHNFRKYKKQTIKDESKTNVLGQPKPQYQPDEIGTTTQSHIGTGLYQNQRRTYYPKAAPPIQQDPTQSQDLYQTSLNLPSMISNNNNSTEYNQSTMIERQAPQTNSIRRKTTTKHQSIFGMTNFSGSENIISDVNYNVKGSKDTQRIAWEIKFNNQENQQSTDENTINQSQDFIYSELQKHRQTQNKSPLIKQFRQNLVTNRSNITGGGNTTKTVDTRNVKLLKVSTKTQRMNLKQVMQQGESPNGKAASQTRSINFGALQHGSGETSNRENTKIFRRQAGAIKPKDIRDPAKGSQPPEQSLTIDRHVIQKLEEHKQKKIRIDNEKNKTASFKKSLRTVRQQMQQIKQFEGELPAELIVTGYKKSLKNTVDSNTQSNETTLKEKPPSLKMMNYVGQTPVKDSKKVQYLTQVNQYDSNNGKEVFAYNNVEKDEDFFKTTSEREFNEYMKQHVTEDQSFVQSNEVVNPSANPISDQDPSDSDDMSRDIGGMEHPLGDSQVNIDINQIMVQPQLENEIVQGHNQKYIVRNKVSHQSGELTSMNQSKMTPHHASHQVPKNIDNSIQQKHQWSDAVSAQTHFLFNKVVRENTKIQKKLRMLQDVGFTNQSNSLFQQILEDIQRVESGMTRNDIINCIKASSFGKASNIEPHHSTDQKSVKMWQVVRRSQNLQFPQQQKKFHYSGDQSRGYSQYQRDFQIESMFPDDQNQKQNIVKSKSVKSSFWRQNTFSKNHNKRFHSKSYQQFKSQVEVDHEFLLQSVNFTVVRSLNLHSSHYNNSRGFKMQARACDKNSGRANTDRIGHHNNILKRSLVSQNQNRVNLNQPRRDFKKPEILIKVKVPSDEFRQIQTERKYHGKNQRKLSGQQYIAHHEQLMREQISPQTFTGQQQELLSCVKVQQFVHPLQFTKQPTNQSQPRYDFHDIKKNPNSDSFSRLRQSHNLQEMFASNPNSSSECHTNPNNNVVLLTVKPSALLFDQSQHMPTSDNKEESRHQSSNSFKTDLPKKQQQIQPTHKKFTSYAYHNVQDQVSSGSVPSQSYNSLPFLQDCTSSNVRFKQNAELQSSSGGNGNSNDKRKYNAKYNKSIQIAQGKKLEESGAFGKGQFNEPEQGKIFKWRQGDIIGLGSSSVVYLAIRTDINQILAVKKFRVVSDITGVDQGKLQTIKNEIQKYKQLEHQNIVKFYGCELLNQFFCMYLEKLDTSLANLLSDNGSFDESTIREYTIQILEGLRFLHEKKIKHLDLKCSNILTNNKSDKIIKLCDFGSAKEFKKGSNQATTSFTSMKNQIVGSVQWMAPEVIAEEGSGSKSDIWSLGCTVVEMFTGGNPWGDKLDDQNLFQAQRIILQSDELPALPADRAVSIECQSFIAQCLTREYNKRPSAEQLLEHPWIQGE